MALGVGFRRRKSHWVWDPKKDGLFEFLKKGGHLARTVVKNRVSGCKICVKEGGLLTDR